MKYHKIFVPFIFALLMAAIYSGVQLAGLNLPGDFLAGKHAPLIIVGFFSALISLERAVALRRPWTFIPTLLFITSAVLLLFHPSLFLPAVLSASGGIIFSLVMGRIFLMQKNLPHLTMGTAAVLLAVSFFLWAGGFNYSTLAKWWMAFLILTIAGERLELARLVKLTPSKTGSFVATNLLLIAGLVISTFDTQTGNILFSFALIFLSAWLFFYDIARRTVKASGLTKFIAINLLIGYFWMGIGGIFGIVQSGLGSPHFYDAFLHAELLGFVFSMIFAHAPIILPSVGGVNVRFSNLFYIHTALLHLSLLTRVLGGILQIEPVWSWSALGNAISIIIFFAVTIAHVKR